MPPETHTTKIDNPGQGDCGYYSFAIGIISELLKELRSIANSLHYDSIESLLETNFSMGMGKFLAFLDANTENPSTVPYLANIYKQLEDNKCRLDNKKELDEYTMAIGQKQPFCKWLSNIAREANKTQEITTDTFSKDTLLSGVYLFRTMLASLRISSLQDAVTFITQNRDKKKYKPKVEILFGSNATGLCIDERINAVKNKMSEDKGVFYVVKIPGTNEENATNDIDLARNKLKSNTWYTVSFDEDNKPSWKEITDPTTLQTLDNHPHNFGLQQKILQSQPNETKIKQKIANNPTTIEIIEIIPSISIQNAKNKISEDKSKVYVVKITEERIEASDIDLAKNKLKSNTWYTVSFDKYNESYWQEITDPEILQPLNEHLPPQPDDLQQQILAQLPEETKTQILSNCDQRLLRDSLSQDNGTKICDSISSVLLKHIGELTSPDDTESVTMTNIELNDFTKSFVIWWKTQNGGKLPDTGTAKNALKKTFFACLFGNLSLTKVEGKDKTPRTIEEVTEDVKNWWENPTLKQPSIAIKVADTVKELGKWATEVDLSALAICVGATLSVVKHNIGTATNPEQETKRVAIENVYGFHWVTHISFEDSLQFPHVAKTIEKNLRDELVALRKHIDVAKKSQVQRLIDILDDKQQAAETVQNQIALSGRIIACKEAFQEQLPNLRNDMTDSIVNRILDKICSFFRSVLRINTDTIVLRSSTRHIADNLDIVLSAKPKEQVTPAKLNEPTTSSNPDASPNKGGSDQITVKVMQ